MSNLTPKQEAEALVRGRPTAYEQELADTIIARLAAGESLRAICKDPGMPAESTVRLWATDNRNGFSAHYTRAREAQMDALAEDILEIADDEGEDVNRARLRVDTRKWLMSKIAPKRFGERKSHEVAGPNGGPLQTISLDRLKGMTDEELEVLERALVQIGVVDGDPSGEGEPEE